MLLEWCTKSISFELFLSILWGLGRGEGGAPGTVPLQNPKVTSRKACFCLSLYISISICLSLSIYIYHSLSACLFLSLYIHHCNIKLCIHQVFCIVKKSPVTSSRNLLCLSLRVALCWHVSLLPCLSALLDGQNRQSPIASVHQTRSTLASPSAIPQGTNVNE